MAGFDTYEKQVAFLRRMIKSGVAKKINTWTHGMAHGDGWCGEIDGFRFRFDTCGKHLVAGSFTVRAV